MHIVIIGAGLGGLTAAYVFARNPEHHVTVLEQYPYLSPRGGGMMVRPNASRFALSWGLGPDFEAVADKSPATLLRDIETGQISVRKVAVNVAEFPDWGVERKVMLRFLHQRAVEAGAKVEFGTKVLDFVEDERGATVFGEAGKKWNANLVIAADGIRSQVREKILKDMQTPIKPVVSSSTHYGIDIAIDELRGDRDGKELLKEPHLTIYVGKGTYVTTRLHEKAGHWTALFSINEKPVLGESLWNEEGDINRLRSSFSTSCAPLRAALRMAKRCDRWKIVEVPNLPRWASNKGFVLILGDAAHPMHPTAAQGFSQTIEDVAVLEYLLKTRPYLPIPSITLNWEQIRRPRVETIKAYAYANMQLFTGETASKVMVAKTELADKKPVKSLKDIGPDPNADFQAAPFLKWVLDYNSIEETEKWLQEQEKARL